jgi:hypothetical protein
LPNLHGTFFPSYASLPQTRNNILPLSRSILKRAKQKGIAVFIGYAFTIKSKI